MCATPNQHAYQARTAYCDSPSWTCQLDLESRTSTFLQSFEAEGPTVHMWDLPNWPRRIVYSLQVYTIDFIILVHHYVVFFINCVYFALAFWFYASDAPHSAVNHEADNIGTIFNLEFTATTTDDGDIIHANCSWLLELYSTNIQQLGMLMPSPKIDIGYVCNSQPSIRIFMMTRNVHI